MAVIRVRVTDQADAFNKGAEVDDALASSEVLNELRAALAYPIVDPQGRPITYRLAVRAEGGTMRDLEGSIALAEQHVVAGQTLVIRTDVVAGRERGSRGA